MENHRDYIKSVIRKIKRFNKYNSVIILFVCFLLLIITDTSITESTHCTEQLVFKSSIRGSSNYRWWGRAAPWTWWCRWWWPSSLSFWHNHCSWLQYMISIVFFFFYLRQTCLFPVCQEVWVSSLRDFLFFVHNNVLTMQQFNEYF